MGRGKLYSTSAAFAKGACKCAEGATACKTTFNSFNAQGSVLLLRSGSCQRKGRIPPKQPPDNVATLWISITESKCPEICSFEEL